MLRRKINKEKRTRFTLVELLVVISIICILAGMLLPALSKARNTTKAIACKNNLKQLGIGLNCYTVDYNGWLSTSTNTNGDVVLSLHSGSLASYLGVDKQNVTEFLKWNAKNVLNCPSNTWQDGYCFMDYSSNSNIHPVVLWSGAVQKKLDAIRNPSAYISHGDSSIDSSRRAFDCFITGGSNHPIMGAEKRMGFHHNNAANSVFVDGHVATVKFNDMRETLIIP